MIPNIQAWGRRDIVMQRYIQIGLSKTPLVKDSIWSITVYVVYTLNRKLTIFFER